MQLNGQNLHDEEHSLKFASYLYQTKQYAYAAEEFEHVFFFDSANISSKIFLISSYRKAGLYEQGFLRLTQIEPLHTNINPTLADEYFKLAFLRNDYASLACYLNKNISIDSLKMQTYHTAYLMLSLKTKQADEYARIHPMVDLKYRLLLADYHTEGRKSPFAAACLSGIIPGMGKIYAGRYWDGFVSFLLVAANSWQAYRGFSKYGVNSAYGWTFGGLALGFYGGNIYGSVKAAQQYNLKRDENFIKATQSILYPAF
jgi:hypothetical protein